MWRQACQHWFEQQWQGTGLAQGCLRPVAWLFAALVALRRWAYRVGCLRSSRLPVPVIVVGNLSVGGVGKTPLVTLLAQQLRAAGYQPGVLSRGYGGQRTGEVRPDSDPRQLGDEPVLLARRTGCPVWVHPARVQAGRALLTAYPQVNVLLCDDGLQHYALQRDIEIAVVQRPLGVGNGQLLPAGPLREPLSRLAQVDLIVETGEWPAVSVRDSYMQRLQPGLWTAVADGTQQVALAALAPRPLMAVAGIGHPQRFFDSLHAMGLQIHTRVFADHHQYQPEDLADLADYRILMTEKDAVKCAALGLKDAWYLPVTAEVLPRFAKQPSLLAAVIQRLEHCKGAVA